MQPSPDMNAGLLTNIRVVLIESDEATASILLDAMTRAGFDAAGANTGTDGLLLKAKLQPHVVLMDMALPDVSGTSLLSRLARTRDCGIVVLSDFSDETERIIALELGADDYVVKPARLRELVARIRAVHRRVGREPARPVVRMPGSATVVTIGPIHINLTQRMVHGTGGQRIMLTAAEYDVLKALACAAGAPMSRDALSKTALNRPWLAEDRSVDQLMFNLRRKLPADTGGELLIQSIRGAGYWMRAPDGTAGCGPLRGASGSPTGMAA